VTAQGPPSKILCIHGIWGGGWIWEPWADRFTTAGFDVHTPTLSDHVARSRRSPSGREYVAQLAQKFELGASDWIIGHSGGAIISLALAAQTKNLAGVILLCPAPPRGARPALSLGSLRLAPKIVRSLLGGAWVPPVRPAIHALGMNVLEDHRHDHVLGQHVEESRRYLLELGIQRFGFRRGSLPKDILVVAANDDRTIPLRSVQSTARKLRATLHEIPESGHYLPIESKGEACQHEVLRWMIERTPAR
jgi:pimeloyl-ACP methyl ester carboxylesterase